MPSHSSAATRLTWLVLVVSSLLTAGFMVYAAQPWRQEFSLWLAMLAFGIWGLSPYGGLARLSRRASEQMLLRWLVLLVSLLVGTSAVFLLYQAFVADPDPQNGLVFVFLPAYQWLAVGILSLAVAVWRRRTTGALTSG